MGGDIRRILNGQRFRDGAHDAPLAPPRTIVGKLLEDRRRIHAIERWNEVTGICSRALMTGSAVQCDISATLGISGTDLVERGLRPGDIRRDTKGWLWAARRAGVERDAKTTADRGPKAERLSILLIAT